MLLADSDQGVFARRGVQRAHWDCWDACNLACPFCFRSRGPVLSPGEAQTVVRRLAHGGISQLALTGGDPSLRKDLPAIVETAQALGMDVEVLTNAQHQSRAAVDGILAADLVGLSLDGSTPERHDAFRARTGNFRRVTQLMETLDRHDRRYVVRTVVSATNADDVLAIGHVLRGRPGLVRWGLQQFSPIEQGFDVRGRYEIPTSVFDAVCDSVTAVHGGALPSLTFLSDEGKTGLYLLMNPAGDVFGRVQAPPAGHHPTVGNILHDDLGTLATAFAFDATRHADRYGRWFELDDRD